MKIQTPVIGTQRYGSCPMCTEHSDSGNGFGRTLTRTEATYLGSSQRSNILHICLPGPTSQNWMQQILYVKSRKKKEVLRPGEEYAHFIICFLTSRLASNSVQFQVSSFLDPALSSHSSPTSCLKERTASQAHSNQPATLSSCAA